MLKQGLKQINKQITTRFSYGFGSGLYAQKIYQRYLQDPTSVSEKWQTYFENNKSNIKERSDDCISDVNRQQIAQKGSQLYDLIRAFRYRGHEDAIIDPLQLDDEAQKQSGYKYKDDYLLVENFGFSQTDLDQIIINKPNDYLGYFLVEQSQWTLREIVNRMKSIYCNNVGYEYLHITEENQKIWLRQQIESNQQNNTPTNEERRKTLVDLMQNHQLNEFMKEVFTTSKRFGVEGLDGMISGLNQLIEYSAIKHNVNHMVLGMAHRGRLNTLALVFEKEFDEIFAEFQDLKGEPMLGSVGDVKYHLGTTVTRKFTNDNQIELTILPNPSHLETVNPIVYGSARSIQDFTNDNNKKQTYGVLIHGDAAFAGQGVVYECLQFQNLNDYTSGGIIHIISNNQIGFTTTPKDARTGLYCTEIAKAIGAPIFHVNADEPDEINRVIQLGFEYRQKFNKDVVIDIIGYRKYGHNELDQPSFTQPLMYKKVAKMEAVYLKYKRRLIQDAVITENEINQMESQFYSKLREKYNESKIKKFNLDKWRAKAWEKPLIAQLLGKIKDTGVRLERLRELGQYVNRIDEGMKLHPQIQKIYEQRLLSIENGVQIDFGTAEQLAFGELIQEGYGIRLSGQDVERGTFSHRHAVLHDQQKDMKYVPLHRLCKDESDRNKVTFTNSHLSEYGVLGFEFGYSMTNPNHLVIWEAQFGDFTNEAQIIIDNYIVASESKWGVQSGIVLSLPHGMDGQGPEHSSARMERFLMLVDDDVDQINPNRTKRIREQVLLGNIQIVQCSTPAQYFHVLRRQMKRNFRKPLICFVNKKLLKYRNAFSSLSEFDQGLRFQRAISDSSELVADDQVKKVVICSGQAYYEVFNKRESMEVKDMAIIRIEQIAPFPYEHFKNIVQNYINAEFIWFQEEHKNMGAWVYVEPRINIMLEELNNQVNGFRNKDVNYVGRRTSASPAAGTQKMHKQEQDQIIEQLFC